MRLEWGQSPLSHIFRADRRSAGGSPDGDGGAFPYQRVKSGGITVRKADAAMASGAAYGIGDGAAVDADAGAVQSGPEDADGFFGAGGKVVKFIGALPARSRRGDAPTPQDDEIVAEPLEWHSPRDAPLSGGRRVLRGARRKHALPCGRGRGRPVGGGMGVIVERARYVGHGDGRSGRGATFRLHLDSPINPVAKFLAMQVFFSYYS